MLSVIFKLMVTQPKAMLIHANNYADLLVDALRQAFQTWRLVLLLHALSLACLGLSLVCTVVSVLLWGALPVLNPTNAWVLVALPVLLFVAGLVLHQQAKRYSDMPFFIDVQEQLRLDLLAIRQATHR